MKKNENLKGCILYSNTFRKVKLNPGALSHLGVQMEIHLTQDTSSKKSYGYWNVLG